MRKVRLIMLLAALICTGIACKKDGSSLKDKKNELSVAADERAQIIAEFEKGTGLTTTNQTPVNAGSPLEFSTVQEAVNYVNSLVNGGPTQLENPGQLNLPVPDDDQDCYTCKTVKVIGTVMLSTSILIGYLRFKRLGPELQYSFLSDSWMLAGIHAGLESYQPIEVNFYNTTSFRFRKRMEYYLGLKIKGLDLSVSIPFSVVGFGSVMDGTIPGIIGFP